MLDLNKKVHQLTTGYIPVSSHYLQLSVCTSLTPTPMTWVFGLGMRLYIRMHTRLPYATDTNQPICTWQAFTSFMPHLIF